MCPCAGVKNPRWQADISTAKSSYTLAVGKTAGLKAKVKTSGKPQPGNVTAIRYRSSDKTIATVTSKGQIKAVGKGTCTAYVIAACGLTKAVKVTVK